MVDGRKLGGEICLNSWEKRPKVKSVVLFSSERVIVRSLRDYAVSFGLFIEAVHAA